MHHLRRRDSRSNTRGHIVRDEFVQFGVFQAELDIDSGRSLDGPAVHYRWNEMPVPNGDQCVLIETMPEAPHNLQCPRLAIGRDSHFNGYHSFDGLAARLVAI